jgi:hypothetical protein
MIDLDMTVKAKYRFPLLGGFWVLFFSFLRPRVQDWSGVERTRSSWIAGARPTPTRLALG